MAIHILHKRGTQRAPIHEDGIMGLSILVFDSSGELVNSPEETVCGVPCRSGINIVVRCSASEEEAVGASTGAPMAIPLGL